MPKETHIAAIYIEEWATVVLACGHRRQLRFEELKREQLFIGKSVPCEECEQSTH